MPPSPHSICQFLSSILSVVERFVSSVLLQISQQLLLKAEGRLSVTLLFKPGSTEGIYHYLLLNPSKCHEH